jgi:hypothetical protein
MVCIRCFVWLSDLFTYTCSCSVCSRVRACLSIFEYNGSEMDDSRREGSSSGGEKSAEASANANDNEDGDDEDMDEEDSEDVCTAIHAILALFNLILRTKGY